MSRFIDASTERLRIASAVSTAYPVTVSAWIYSTQLPTVKGDEESIWSQGDNESSLVDFFNLRIDDGQSNRLQWNVRNGGQTVSSTSSTTISVNTWHHVFGRSVSTTDHACLLDGGSKGSSTNFVAFPDTSFTWIGSLVGIANDNFVGRLAEVAVWNRNITDNEALILARGFPAIRLHPESIIQYTPLWGASDPEPDYSGNGNNFSLVGSPVQADQAPVAIPFGFDLGWRGAFTAAGAPTGIEIFRRRIEQD